MTWMDYPEMAANQFTAMRATEVGADQFERLGREVERRAGGHVGRGDHQVGRAGAPPYVGRGESLEELIQPLGQDLAVNMSDQLSFDIAIQRSRSAGGVAVRCSKRLNCALAERPHPLQIAPHQILLRQA